MDKEYQVWITLEEWEGDDKICDIDANLLGTCLSEDDARQLWDAASAHGFIVKDTLPIKIYDETSIQEDRNNESDTEAAGA